MTFPLFGSARSLALAAALVAAAAFPRSAMPAAGVPPTAGPYYFGADLSYVNELEDCGATYGANGVRRDPFDLLRERGANLVRVRLWNNATWTRYSDLADVKKTIGRAQRAGMQVLLNFHYSDDWADGDKQIIPKAWEHIGDTDALARELYAFTYRTLEELAAADLMPELVQVGKSAPITGPLPGVGLAEHTATVDLWFNRGPIEMRLGYKYHSPFTVIYGWNGADLQSLEEESVLDFSSSYRIGESIDLRLQVNNLTDEPLRMYRDGQADRIGRYDVYGRRYLLDVTFRF